MGYYKLDEIAAIRDDQGNMISIECATEEELADLTEDQIVTDKEVEDPENFFFCDRSKKRITSR